MNSFSIATAKNQLSRLLQRVRRGESILITDRNHPVARFQPVTEGDSSLERLQADGVLNPPAGPALNARALLSGQRPRWTARQSLTSAVLAERAQGR
ncbi:MAG: type II toxin-antitoxin system prevent-host-death family antitoxin [Verrucomicrobiae bacterium]|nr:type II toxin-antitoxin system prevent-host-death family antitoxin [Verrucomicrobiae bacterium]